MNKCILVYGASDNPERYSFKACQKLQDNGYKVIPYGVKEGKCAGLDIVQTLDSSAEIDGVTLYVSPQRQEGLNKFIINLKPKACIFNPGTENPELMDRLEDNGIDCHEACTLVMLSIGSFPL